MAAMVDTSLLILWGAVIHIYSSQNYSNITEPTCTAVGNFEGQLGFASKRNLAITT
jgi:hypothetical protein